MKLINLKRVSDLKVKRWLEDSLKLSDYQKNMIREDEIICFAPFEFYECRKKVDNIFIRFSIIFLLLVYILLVIGLPFNFFLTGNWGYKKIEWFSKWSSACGF